MIDQTMLKREEKAVFALRELYRGYGYLPYQIRKFEEYDYYIRNKDFLVSDRIITFTDSSGRLMALKPDVTLSIIKHSDDQPGCKRKVCYNESVYRAPDGDGQFREIMQTGLECIGAIDLYDIYEAVSLAARSLGLIGEEFVLQISHLGVLSAVLDSVCSRSGFRRSAASYIAGKNAHDLARLCEEYGVAPEQAEKLGRFVRIYGQRQRVLDELEELWGDVAREHLEQLRQLSRMLRDNPYSDRIVFDFSLVNDMNYYSGIVFRGYISGVCGGILSGGQYDALMSKMGSSSGAIGFALYLDMLEQLTPEQAGFDVDVLLVYDDQTEPEALAKQISALREGGKSVSAQRGVPRKLRYRECVDLRKEAGKC